MPTTAPLAPAMYQGRFKSFPCQDDEHFYTLCRYVERNAFKANLVKRAEAWKWSSLYRWHAGTAKEKELLTKWPLNRKRGWLKYVNKAITKKEEEALARSVKRGCPFGDEQWTEKVVKQLGLESTIRPLGRPKTKNGS